MKLRNRFLSWRKPLYSVPTLRGLIPLGITLYAGFVSFTRGSASHPLLVVLMSLLTVMHLIESSAELRELELEPDPDATVFARVPGRVRLLPRSGTLPAPLDLPVAYRAAGPQPFPEKRVVRIPPSGLFRYWRNFRFEAPAFVLPEPVDHGVPLTVEKKRAPGDPDELVPIRDPRLLPFRDQKIFLKTGKSLIRWRTSAPSRGGVRLDWESLGALPPPLRYEQLSFWIQKLEAQRGLPAQVGGGIEVSTPFFPHRVIRSTEEWREFKRALAETAAENAS